MADSLEKTDELAELRRQLVQIKEQMASLESKFNLTCNEDMIEVHIYEMKALDARYQYIYKRAKSISGML